MKWIRRTRKKEKERDDRLRELMIKSDYLIYKKKLFLKLDFSKQDLASELGTNRTYLGEAMSVCGRCKWDEYINSFRLRYFMEEMCMKDTRGVRLADLAERCGFGSTATLNRCMKKKYGITAAAYRKSITKSFRG